MLKTSLVIYVIIFTLGYALEKPNGIYIDCEMINGRMNIAPYQLMNNMRTTNEHFTITNISCIDRDLNDYFARYRYKTIGQALEHSHHVITQEMKCEYEEWTLRWY